MWNTERYLALQKAARVTDEDLAKATGIPFASIRQYHAGGAPSLNRALAIARFFGVSLEYLCGEITEEEEQRFQGEYPARFLSVRRASWELYLSCNQVVPTPIKGTISPPYPYNLLTSVFGEWDNPITKEQSDGLHSVLLELPEKERLTVLRYYKDGEPQSLIAKEQGVSCSAIGFRLKSALRNLQSPESKHMILFGPELLYRNQALEEMRRNLDVREQAIRKREIELNKRDWACAEKEKQVEIAELKLAEHLLATPIEKLGLSNHSRNGLFNAGCHDLSDIVHLVESGKLAQKRMIGSVAIFEILTMIKKMTANDFGHLYGVRI